MSKGLQSLIEPYFLRRTKAEVFVKAGQSTTGNAPKSVIIFTSIVYFLN